MPIDLVKKAHYLDFEQIASKSSALTLKSLFISLAASTALTLGLVATFAGLTATNPFHTNVSLSSSPIPAESAAFPPSKFALWLSSTDLGYLTQNFGHCPTNETVRCFRAQIVSARACTSLSVSLATYIGTKKVRYKTLQQYTVPSYEVVDFIFEYEKGSGVTRKVENISCS